MVPGESIDMQLLEGPFSHLERRLVFHAWVMKGVRCRWILILSFPAGCCRPQWAGFCKAMNKMVEAFCQRAEQDIWLM